MIKRIALGLRYDGSRYHGWQSQGQFNTVQEYVEHGLARVANHPVTVMCAGRTDAGVHATAQVVHFDTEADRHDHSWVFGANSNLPHDISVLWAKEVDRTFHARFSATGRRYRYILYNHPVRPAILRHYVGWYHKPLNETHMLEAANHLIGEHDFSAYRGADCQAKTPNRIIYHLDVKRQGPMIIIEAYANAFLLHMVRNIAGVLIEIGAGTREPIWSRNVLESRDRQQGGITFSPNGLYLVEVDYPQQFNLPIEAPVGPFFLTA